MARRLPAVVVGIDLAGSPRRPTGMCMLRDLAAETRVVFSDDEILNFVNEARPVLIPIDAPLSLPNGRLTILLGQGLMLGGNSGFLIPAVDGLKVKARVTRLQ